MEDDSWDTLKQVAQEAASAKGAFDFSNYLLPGGSNGTNSSTSSSNSTSAGSSPTASASGANASSSSS